MERAPDRKPVYEPVVSQKAPSIKSPRPYTDKEEPLAKQPKFQEQAPLTPEDRYRAELKMQVEGEEELPLFEKRIALYGAALAQESHAMPKKRTPVPESPLLARKRLSSHEASPAFVTSKEKPSFAQVNIIIAQRS